MIELPLCCSFIFFGAIIIFAVKELLSRAFSKNGDKNHAVPRRDAVVFDDDEMDAPEWEHDLGKKEVIEDMEFDPLKYGWDDR